MSEPSWSVPETLMTWRKEKGTRSSILPLKVKLFYVNNIMRHPGILAKVVISKLSVNLKGFHNYEENLSR